MKIQRIISILCLSAFFSYLQATVYENAEDGKSDRWIIYDQTPAGASVDNIIDNDKGSRVIQLNEGEGDGSNGFMIGGISGASKWHNTSEKFLKWSMKFNQFYTIYVSLDTTKGLRFIKYTPLSHNLGDVGNGYIHIGLGSNSDNGEWISMVRNPAADLQAYEPDNQVVAINGFLVRGVGLLDDIELLNSKPKLSDKVYEDGENGNTDGWIVYDATPEGATISNVIDEGSNHVIALQGDGVKNGYMFGNWSGRIGAWYEMDRKVISWKMKFSESYAFYITVQTKNGRRYMYYNTQSQDRGIVGEGKYIHHGLGSKYMTGTWNCIILDLEKDLKDFEPNNTILSVNGLLVRGSGKIDDIILSDGMPSLPPTVYEDAENGLSPAWITVIGNTPPSRHTANGHTFVKLPPHWEHLDNGNWKNNAEYHLPMNDSIHRILSVDIGGDGNNMPHYVLGVKTTTTDGPRIILWDSWYTHEGYPARIARYGANSATIIFPSPVEQVRGWGYADVNLWENFTIDLEEALHAFEPDNTILSVDHFVATGGNLDNLTLK